ncbi:MAG: hypothetical protein VX516_01250 [Actinomycetota bacterium]|nr:hypothetical protein [Actinomycetota bacterium]MEE3250935.1 hypothetical protein [Actinomycetota bacterium]MEE3275034.1 hypothetical protein [Actinomycetota bacterium]
MKWLIAVLACVAMGSGCGLLGDDGFTGSDWDELHDWCLDNRGGRLVNCGGLVDEIEWLVNDRGHNEDCLVRASKRVISAIGDDAIEAAISQMRDCQKDN